MTEVEGSLLLDVDKGTPVVRPRGLYSPTETYVYDHEFRDMVEFRASDSGGVIKSYYFLVRNRWDKLKGIAPVPGDASSSRKWEQSSDFKFITAGSIVADMIHAGAITADKLYVAGFNFEDNLIWGGSKFGLGKPGIAIQYLEGSYGFNVYKDNKNYVEMFQRSSEWGLKGVVNGKTTFQLGSINKIGGFLIDDNILKYDGSSDYAGIKAQKYYNSDYNIDFMSAEIGLLSGSFGQFAYMGSFKNHKTGTYSSPHYNVGIVASAKGAVANYDWSNVRNLAMWAPTGDVFIESGYLITCGIMYSLPNCYQEISGDYNMGDYTIPAPIFKFNSNTTLTLPKKLPDRFFGRTVIVSGGTTGGRVNYSNASDNYDFNLIGHEAVTLMFVDNTKKWIVLSGRK